MLPFIVIIMFPIQILKLYIRMLHTNTHIIDIQSVPVRPTRYQSSSEQLACNVNHINQSPQTHVLIQTNTHCTQLSYSWRKQSALLWINIKPIYGTGSCEYVDRVGTHFDIILFDIWLLLIEYLSRPGSPSHAYRIYNGNHIVALPTK